VLRTLDNRLGGALFLNLSVAKHQQPVGAFGGQRQIVGDKQHGGTRLAAQDIEQVENALLHRDVEGAGGLIGNDQSGCRAMAMAISTRCFIPPES
jgi:hypothetical protein